MGVGLSGSMKLQNTLLFVQKELDDYFQVTWICLCPWRPLGKPLKGRDRRPWCILPRGPPLPQHQFHRLHQAPKQKEMIYLREDINSKKTFSFGPCPNHLNPPPLTPIRATWSFFSDVKNDVLARITVWGVYRPLRAKSAIPHPITIRNIRSDRK